MDKQTKALLLLAKENPWRLFTGQEIALICGISERTLNLVRSRKDSPFCAGRCRPEHLVEWFLKHPGWQPSKERMP